MDERRVADYFVVAGLPPCPSPLEDFSRDGATLKSTHNQAPITDLAVIFPSLGEEKPDDFTQLWTTPTGHPANLNHGSLRSPSVFLCYRRGWDRLPLVDIGVYNEGGKENVMSDVEVVTRSPYGRQANVNNSNGSRVYITYRRAVSTDPCNILVVTDVCVILENKDEKPPHTFCKIPSNLNKGLLGSDVFLCYKKSMNRVNSLAYKPEMLARFPLKNHEKFPLPDSVPLFCLPMGANVECWPETAKHPPDVFSTFVLTVFVSDSVEKVYGTAVMFYERYSASKLTASELDKLGFSEPCSTEQQRTIHVNKCLCILSRWPFFDTFHKFLEYLHLMSLSETHHIPIERYISHFMQEVPFPSLQRPRILIQLDAQNMIALAQPEDSPLPLSGASFKELLKNLGPDNCMIVLLYALTEQKILLHSLRPDVLTSVAEAISMFIFPFHWQCPYIPLCPLGLSDVLSAPMPFIVGVDSRYFDLYDPPSDVFCIDLDTVVTSACEEKKTLNVKLFPKKPARVLRNTLGHLFERLHQTPAMQQQSLQVLDGDVPIDLDFRVKKHEGRVDVEIQEAFLRFMATILKGFRSYLLPITRAPTIGSTDPNSLFDIHGFLKSRDKSYHRFYNLLMRTQMFTRFIEERSFVTDKDASLAFFDECTEKVEAAVANGSKDGYNLLDQDDSHQSDRTVFVPPPDTTGLPHKKTYSYNGRFQLDPTLYHAKDRITNLSVSCRASPAPNSPLARRTKQEIRSAQKLAKKQSEDPDQWAKCLQGYSYSLWFIHLPAFVKESRSKSKALGVAFEILLRMQVSHLKNIDEVCYRVLMQLCGQYGEPILAIKIYSNMKNNGFQPNAITYGYYNKAVLENKWPSSNRRSGILWTKLRNVILGAAQFRQSLGNPRPLSSYSESDAASSESGVLINDLSPLVKENDDGSSVGILATGAQSDVGYSSMNLDEVQKSSSSINSSTRTFYVNVDGVKDEGKENDHSTMNIVRNLSSSDVVRRRLSSEGCRPKPRSTRFNSLDLSESNEFRSRVGSIVRNPVMSIGKLSSLRESTSVDSSAGLLITGHLMYDDVFVESSGDASKKTKPSLYSRRRHRSYDLDEITPPSIWTQSNSSPVIKQQCLTPSSTSPSHRTSGDGDTSAELLRCSSFASDARILSNLSQSDENVLGVGLSMKSRTTPLDGTASMPSNTKGLACDGDVPLQLCNGIISPQLIPVTQNDPLGVFSSSSPMSSVASHDSWTLQTNSRQSSTPIINSNVRKSLFGNSGLSRADPKRFSVTMGRSKTGRGGVLVSSFSRRSASFCNGPNCNINGAKNHHEVCGLSRSSTLPNTSSLNTSSSVEESGDSFASLVSPLRTQLSSFTSRFSSFGTGGSGRKSSEVSFFGGLHGLKTAANNVANKLGEIKEAISSTSFVSVPTSPNMLSNAFPKPFEMEKKLLYDDDLETTVTPIVNCGFDNESRRASSTMTEINDRNKFGNMEKLLEQCGSCGSLDGLKTSLLTDVLPHVVSEPLLDTNQGFLVMESPRNQLPMSLSSSKRRPDRLALEILMTTCSRCHCCSSLLYDEEIMSSWTPEDSNLNTRCAFCHSKVVPLLTVTVKDYRSDMIAHDVLSPAQSTDSIQSGITSVGTSAKIVDVVERHASSRGSDDSNIASSIGSPAYKQADDRTEVAQPQPGAGSLPSSVSSSMADICADNGLQGIVLEPISVPYLSPIVLRKELETVLEHEGDMCLTKPNFVDEHPIIFWNMLWYCNRIKVPTHLHWLCLRADVINGGRQEPKDNCLTGMIVLVRCMWDNPRLHEKMGPAMYMLSSNMTKNPDIGSSLVHALVTEPGPIPRGTIQQIVSDISCNDLSGPLKIMLNNLLKKGSVANSTKGQHHSIYRQLLFLSIVVFGRKNIDLRNFEIKYRQAFSELTTDQFVLSRQDYPLSRNAIVCRSYFSPLEL